MKKNRFVNRYDDKYYPTWLEALAIFSIVSVITMICVNVRLYDKMTTSPGQLDCAECHSIEFHETKKMQTYLRKIKHKNPSQYLAVN